ncbi:MAG: phosphatidate cytidylyltransferase [Proteobacteria bacterium]|nr:phosphatidate cytidylyltransferase [Pseudomonadota bacterium]
MLWQRILTALCLIPLVLGAVIYLNTLYFSVLSLLVFAWGAFEWANLCEYSSTRDKGLYVLLFVSLGALLGWCGCQITLLVGVLFWCIASYWILTYKTAPIVLQNKIGTSVIGLIVLLTAWQGLCLTQKTAFGPLWVILLFIIVWASDTFAYFVGKKMGQNPLAVTISPKKTLEGFWGALFLTLLLGLIIYFVLKSQPSIKSHIMPFSAWMSIVYITILLSVVGDLFESLLKRLCGVKDSGTLLPGHGGLLDRVDSLLAALPFYALSIAWVTR